MTKQLSGWAVGVSALALVSCGGSGAAPQSPAAPSATAAGAGSGYVMASSQGLAPEGFKLSQRLDPKPGLDGVIREGSPVTVTVDLCGSTPDDGKTLHFLFDWNFDDVADVVGTGDTCLQKHTFKTPATATQDTVLEANVCVTNGDPNVHNGSVYFSCRVVRVGVPRAKACGDLPGLPAGCQNGTFDGDPFSISWPGGPGPHDDVPGFDDPNCQPINLEGTADGVVFAETQEQAECLCGEEANGPPDTDFSGLRAFFCGPQPTLAKTTAGAFKKAGR